MCRLLVAVSLAMFALGPLRAELPALTGTALAEKFGSLESIEQISLSPDAARIAFVAPNGDGQLLYVADLTAGGSPVAILKAEAGQGRLQWCSWAASTRLVCQFRIVVNDSGLLLGFSRMIALDADGKRMIKLSQEANSRSLGQIQNGGSVLDWDIVGKPGQLLMTREYVPERSTGTHIYNELQGLGVDMVDSISLRRSKIEGPRKGAFEYITDGHGTVRIMGVQVESSGGYDANKVSYYYRKTGSRDWEKLSSIGLAGGSSEGGFEPYAVDPNKNVVYGFDAEKGMTALFSIALDGSGKREMVLGRSDVDVDQLITIGRDQRVVGASYATERRTTEYFDPELKALGAALSGVLPGRPTIDIVDANDDESKLLLLATSDTNPGMFYLFDKATRKLEELLPVRNELAGMKLAEMKPVTYTATDGTRIPAYLTLPVGGTGKSLPAIVMPHGGPGSRDEWGFDWLVQYYAARGYAVLQPNFRGSAGYGSVWYQQNGFKSWRVAIGDVNDAGRWLIKEGIADPAKLGIVGWSYGGYAALQSSILDPALFKAIVAIAPVTDLEKLRQEAEPFSNFPIVSAFIGTGAHIREGSPAQNAAAIRAPVLLFHGTMDQNVGSGQSRLMEDKLKAVGKQATLIEFPGLDHQLSNPAARKRMLAESDQFLRKAFGLPAE